MSPSDIEKVLVAIKALGDSSPVFVIAVIIVLIVALFGAITKLLEALIKIFGAASSSVKVCVSLIKGGRVRRDWLNRRKQFLRVLSADLSAIANVSSPACHRTWK